MPKSVTRPLWALLLLLPLASVSQAREVPATAPATTPAASRCDPLPFADADAAAATVPSAANAWGGPRTGNEATLSDRVVHYTIHATLDPDKHTIDGRSS